MVPRETLRQTIAKDGAVDPDEYRKERGRCPRGYTFDGEKCIEKAPKKGKDAPSDDAEPELEGQEPVEDTKPSKKQTAPKKGKAKPKKPAVKPQGPTEKITKDNPYGLAQSVRLAKTVADIGGHEALRKVLGHMHPSKLPPPDIDPATIELNLDGDNDSKALMTWRDAKGRKQPAYTPKFLNRNAAKKWERVKKFDKKADKAIEKFGKAMQSKKASTKERDAAAIMTIIGKTGLRPGSMSGLKDTGNRGISTLSADNVKVTGDTVSLEFVGKSGKTNKTQVQDPALAQYLQERLKGKAGDDLLFEAHERDLPGAMKAAGVGGFKPKDFRTRKAGQMSADALSKVDDPPPLPADAKEAKSLIAKRVKEVSTLIADQLNNTPAMAKTAYIDPAIFQAWAKVIGAEKYLATAAVKKPSADELWKSALDITLPDADKPVEIDPELEDDEQLDSVPEPLAEEVEEEAVSAHVERIVAGLVAANHRDLAGLLFRTL